MYYLQNRISKNRSYSAGSFYLDHLELFTQVSILYVHQMPLTTVSSYYTCYFLYSVFLSNLLYSTFIYNGITHPAEYIHHISFQPSYIQCPVFLSCKLTLLTQKSYNLFSSWRKLLFVTSKGNSILILSHFVLTLTTMVSEHQPPLLTQETVTSM